MGPRILEAVLMAGLKDSSMAQSLLPLNIRATLMSLLKAGRNKGQLLQPI